MAKVETKKSMASMTDFKVNSDPKPWSLAGFLGIINYPVKVKYREYFISQSGLNHPIQFFLGITTIKSSNKDPDKTQRTQPGFHGRHATVELRWRPSNVLVEIPNIPFHRRKS